MSLAVIHRAPTSITRKKESDSVPADLSKVLKRRRGISGVAQTIYEHQVAHQDPGSYEVHFWGEINLRRNPDLEFNTLRQQGFPLRFEDLPAHLADHRLQATPIRYMVTRGTGI